MNLDTSNLSCGTGILYNMQYRERRTVLAEFKEVLKDWFSQGYRPRTIVFSDKAGVANPGARLAVALAEHPELGTLVSTAVVRNRNSGNDIQTHMFSLTDTYMDEVTEAGLSAAGRR